MDQSKFIASFFGIGYIKKGAGTVAAALLCGVLYLGEILWRPSGSLLLIFTLLVMAIGIYTGSQVEKDWGKDSNKVVIDEVLGMLVSMLFIPVNILNLVSGFVLFRFFDIVKPLGIRSMEKFPGGWGVMLDDLLAGVYANVVLQALLYFVYR